MVRYTRSKGDEDILFVQPRFELGYPRNTQLSLTLPFVSKLGNETKLGTFRVEALYNLNQETLTVPAFSLVGALDVPTGHDAEGGPTNGVDPIIRGYLTKAIPGTMYFHRVHLNGSYQFNADRQDGERDGRYVLGVGYDFRITSSTIGVIDYVRQQQMKREEEQNLLELGARVQVNPLLVLSTGLSVGVAAESPRVRVTGGLQYRPF